MGGNRELFRVGIVREGIARNGSTSAPCIVTELTSQGIGLHADLPTAPGDRLDLTFQLTHRHRISCRLLVTHADSPRLGGSIAAIADEDRRQLTRYLEDHAAISLTAF